MMLRVRLRVDFALFFWRGLLVFETAIRGLAAGGVCVVASAC